LMVLELIRNKCVEVYNMIRARELIDYSMDKFVYLFNQEKWNRFAERKDQYLSAVDLDNLKTAIEYLFDDPGYKNHRKILEPPNFYIYFSFQLFNQISLKEFNALLKQDVDTIVKGFNEWIGDKKEGDLIRIIGAMEVFPNANFLQKMITVFCRVDSSSPQWNLYANSFFYSNRAFNLKQYFKGNVAEYKQFIQRLMGDGSIPLFKRASLAYRFLYEIIKGENSTMVFKKREWQRIVYSLFDQYLASTPTDMDKILEFYRLNDYDRESYWILLYPPAGRRLRRYLLKNESAFEQFTRKVIGQRANADPGYFEIHFWTIREVFSIPSYFKSVLESRMFTDKKAAKARDILLTHFDDALDGGKAFFLPESDRPE
jgi:hypothetical protein